MQPAATGDGGSQPVGACGAGSVGDGQHDATAHHDPGGGRGGTDEDRQRNRQQQGQVDDGDGCLGAGPQVGETPEQRHDCRTVLHVASEGAEVGGKAGNERFADDRRRGEEHCRCHRSNDGLYEVCKRVVVHQVQGQSQRDAERGQQQQPRDRSSAHQATHDRDVRPTGCCDDAPQQPEHQQAGVEQGRWNDGCLDEVGNQSPQDGTDNRCLAGVGVPRGIRLVTFDTARHQRLLTGSPWIRRHVGRGKRPGSRQRHDRHGPHDSPCQRPAYRWHRDKSRRRHRLFTGERPMFRLVCSCSSDGSPKVTSCGQQRSN